MEKVLCTRGKSVYYKSFSLIKIFFQIFYRKKAVDPSINSIELNEILTPPCDTDEETLSAAECNTDFTR